MLKIAIIGGCGHVGLPLGLAFASKDFQVTLIDINHTVVETVNTGILPFIEKGGDALLKKHIGHNLVATTDISRVAENEIVFFVTGTPVDEHHAPKISEVKKVLDHYLPLLSPDQLIVFRSTLYPGMTEHLHDVIKEKLRWTPQIAFCPERIIQGKGIEEIFTLPQIVAATSEVAKARAIELFKAISPKIIELAPMEAELAKLMANSWRYMEFAIANQFYMMVENMNLDFYRVFNAFVDEYPRAKHFAKPGLTAGPCLFKDTMQLSSFHENQFLLGQAAMLINEGLPQFLVNKLEQKLQTLKGKKILILGMTFKANNDDTRNSLSFKVKKLLDFKLAKVSYHDPYVKNSARLDEAISQADGVILGVPHKEYLNLKPSQPYVDCWNVW